jgi:uncharacterized caspase-like protein
MHMLARSIPITLALFFFAIGSTCRAEQYLFLVGVQDYSQKGELTSLKYAAKDIETLASRFQDAGVRPENIVVMTQQRGATQARYIPSRDQIVKELNLLLEVLRPEDSLIVGFSGHGLQFKGEDVNYFCPIDADPNDKKSLLSLTEVYTQLDSCKAGTKLLLVDACRNDPLSQNSKAARRIEIEPVFSRPAPVFDGGTVAIFSCSESQQSFEHPDIGSGSGVFFHLVNLAFAGEGDQDSDNSIDLLELESFAIKKVPEWTRTKLGRAQTPERRGSTRGSVKLLTVKKKSAERQPTLNPAAGNTGRHRIQSNVDYSSVYQNRTTTDPVEHRVGIDMGTEVRILARDPKTRRVRVEWNDAKGEARQGWIDESLVK